MVYEEQVDPITGPDPDYLLKKPLPEKRDLSAELKARAMGVWAKQEASARTQIGEINAARNPQPQQPKYPEATPEIRVKAAEAFKTDAAKQWGGAQNWAQRTTSNPATELGISLKDRIAARKGDLERRGNAPSVSAPVEDTYTPQMTAMKAAGLKSPPIKSNTPETLGESTVGTLGKINAYAKYVGRGAGAGLAAPGLWFMDLAMPTPTLAHPEGEKMSSGGDIAMSQLQWDLGRTHAGRAQIQGGTENVAQLGNEATPWAAKAGFTVAEMVGATPLYAVADAAAGVVAEKALAKLLVTANIFGTMRYGTQVAEGKSQAEALRAGADDVAGFLALGALLHGAGKVLGFKNRKITQKAAADFKDRNGYAKDADPQQVFEAEMQKLSPREQAAIEEGLGLNQPKPAPKPTPEQLPVARQAAVVEELKAAKTASAEQPTPTESTISPKPAADAIPQEIVPPETPGLAPAAARPVEAPSPELSGNAGELPQAPVQAAKQPWEMTQKEFVSRPQETTLGVTAPKNTKSLHKTLVRNMVRKGENVSPDILADYKGESWADNALAKLSPSGETPVAGEKPVATWDKSGAEMPVVYHGGKRKITAVDTSKLGQRDAGFYGKGFYVTTSTKHSKTYGPVTSEFTFKPESRILDVGTIHPEYEQKGFPKLQKTLEDAYQSELQQTAVERVRSDPAKIDGYVDMIRPQSGAFDLHAWIGRVEKYAKDNGYDAIRWADGEIVILNPETIVSAKKPTLAQKIKQRKAGEADIPTRPMVNPKASAIKQDQQMRAQQNWDKRYGPNPDTKVRPPSEVIPEQAKNGRREILQGRVAAGTDAGGVKLLGEFRGEKWADEALAKLEPTPAIEAKAAQAGEAGTINPGTKINADMGEEGSFDIAKVAQAAKGAGKGGKNIANFFSGEMAQSVTHLPEGKALIQGLDQASSKAASLAGKLENETADAIHGMTVKDRNWLDAIDDQGYPNFQRAVEPTPSGKVAADNPEVNQFLNTYRKMLDLSGAEAERVGMQRLGKDGEMIPFKRAKDGRFLRNPTPDAIDAINREAGPMYDAIAAVVQRDNNMTLGKAKDALREWMGPESVRKVGSLENSRAIPNMPAYVQVNGKWVPILETDPYAALMGGMRRQAQRIYFVETFGQNIKGQETAIEQLRGRFAKAGGSSQTFDDILRVWNHRPYKRIFSDPRSALARSAKIANDIAGSMQTSLSVIPNVPQTAVQVPRYVGIGNYAKAVAKAIGHPRQTISQLAAMGAMNRSVMDWTIRQGSIPEDLTRIGRGILGRATGLHWLSQFNNTVAGQGFKELARQWELHGLPVGDLRVAKELRLTGAEISAIKAGKLTEAIRNKIVQNGVKITQYVTEDPHRMAKMQNIPIANGLWAYNNYAIGTAKSTARLIGDVGEALASKDPRKMLSAAKRLSVFLVSAVGAGEASLMLRRAAKGQPLATEDEKGNPLVMVKNALWEVATLGPAQRMMDAYQYAGGSAEKLFVGFMPKVKLLVDAIGALTGTGTTGKLPAGERIKDVLLRHTPIAKSAANWIDKLQNPKLAEYVHAKRLISHFEKTVEKKPQVYREFEINPEFKPIKDAAKRFDKETFDKEVQKYFQNSQTKGISYKIAKTKLKASLSAGRPINLSEQRKARFFDSLKPQDRDAVRRIDDEYRQLINSI